MGILLPQPSSRRSFSGHRVVQAHRWIGVSHRRRGFLAYSPSSWVAFRVLPAVQGIPSIIVLHVMTSAQQCQVTQVAQTTRCPGTDMVHLAVDCGLVAARLSAHEFSCDQRYALLDRRRAPEPGGCQRLASVREQRGVTQWARTEEHDIESGQLRTGVGSKAHPGHSRLSPRSV